MRACNAIMLSQHLQEKATNFCNADLQKKVDWDFDRINIKLGPWKFGFNLKPRQMEDITGQAGHF